MRLARRSRRAAVGGLAGTIGHNATLHGCAVEDLVLIGMGAIVLNGARVGRHSIIAAGKVSEAEGAAIERNAATYVALSQLHRRGEA